MVDELTLISNIIIDAPVEKPMVKKSRRRCKMLTELKNEILVAEDIFAWDEPSILL